MKSLIKRFVPMTLVEAVVNNEIDYAEITPREIEFIIVKFDDESPASLRQATNDVIEIALEKGAIVEDIVSSLVVLTYGAIGNENTDERMGQELSTLLLEKLGKKIALIYGKRRCFVGNHGSPNRMKFGSLIPGFWDALVRLSKLEFGSMECI